MMCDGRQSFSPTDGDTRNLSHDDQDDLHDHDDPDMVTHAISVPQNSELFPCPVSCHKCRVTTYHRVSQKQPQLSDSKVKFDPFSGKPCVLDWK